MDIKVPAMGESVTEGTLANWLVKPGQAVKQDDPIAEIETDKVAVEVPAPANGVITEQLVKEGETVQIGKIIARPQEGATRFGCSGRRCCEARRLRQACCVRRRLPPRRRARHRESRPVRRTHRR